MPRTVLPFCAADISALARSLSGQLALCDHKPSHVEWLNMLARSLGCRNFQHFRAQQMAKEQLDRPATLAAPVDYVELQHLTRYFDSKARLLRWPSKFSHQEPCLWFLWSKLPSRQGMAEHRMNQLLLEHHQFKDPALLRRELTDRNLVSRTADGREYKRVERQPPAQALALIRQLSAAHQS